MYIYSAYWFLLKDLYDIMLLVLSFIILHCLCPDGSKTNYKNKEVRQSGSVFIHSDTGFSHQTQTSLIAFYSACHIGLL